MKVRSYTPGRVGGLPVQRGRVVGVVGAETGLALRCADALEHALATHAINSATATRFMFATRS